MTTDAKLRDELVDIIEFETTWGRVECHDGDHVWFPRFFGDGIASKINRRKTFVTLTFDGYPKHEDEKVKRLIDVCNDLVLKCGQSIPERLYLQLSEALKEFEK